MSAKKALFSMPALYQPSQSAYFTLLGMLPGSASQISSNILSMFVRRFCFVLVCLLLTACQQSIFPTSLPTLTQPVETPTATHDWFPRTPTPEYTPTPKGASPQNSINVEVSPPASGKALIEDPLRNDQWYLSAPTGGRMALQDGVLSIAADNQKLNFEANSKLVLPPQFFLQLNVELSTCAPDDYYSLSFLERQQFGHICA